MVRDENDQRAAQDQRRLSRASRRLETMKSDEQILNEWVSGEITFSIDVEAQTFNAQRFKDICAFMREGSTKSHSIYMNLRRTWDLRDQLKVAMVECGTDVQDVDNWLDRFFEPRRLIRFSSIADVNAVLRYKALEEREKMGFSVVPELPKPMCK